MLARLVTKVKGALLNTVGFNAGQQVKGTLGDHCG